jgi:IS6 family transposase
MKTAAATIKGFEVMRMIPRRHCVTCKPRAQNEAHFANKLFNIFAVAA